MLGGCVCALGCGLLVLGTAGLQDAGEVVKKLQEKYEQIRSFSAHFQQRFRSRNFQTEESGTVLMKKPGRMYWEYQQPTSKFFVSDGDRIYFYVPKDNQVMVSELDIASTPLLFLLGKGNIEEDFQVEFEWQEEAFQPGNVLLRLTPREPGGEFSYLVLEIMPSSYFIYRLSVIEPIGNRNDYVLTDFRENADISDRRFRLQVPPGVQVIETRP